MRSCWKLLGVFVVFALAATVIAADKDSSSSGSEQTLKGTIGCAKCQGWDKDLKACNIAIKVKDGDKETIYLFDEEGTKKYMGGDKSVESFCKRMSEGSVTCTITEKDGKKYCHVIKLTEK